MCYDICDNSTISRCRVASTDPGTVIQNTRKIGHKYSTVPQTWERVSEWASERTSDWPNTLRVDFIVILPIARRDLGIVLISSCLCIDSVIIVSRVQVGGSEPDNHLFTLLADEAIFCRKGSERLGEIWPICSNFYSRRIIRQFPTCVIRNF